MQETWQQLQIWSLSQENLLEKEMAIHFSILAWEIPWTEKPDRLHGVRTDFICSFFYNKMFSKVFSDGDLVAKSCPTLVTPGTVAPLGSSVHGISQARILKWVTISSSKESSQPRDWTHVSRFGRIACNPMLHWILYHWATREALLVPTFPEKLFNQISQTEAQNIHQIQKGSVILELGMMWKFIQFGQCPPHWALTSNFTVGTRGETLRLTVLYKIF